MSKSVNVYNHERSWRANSPSTVYQVATKEEGISYMDSAMASGAYMCTLCDDETGDMELRYTEQGGKYTYLDSS